MKTSELSGALLDYWAARADESWKWAHELFPAMTLDPTFKGAELLDGGENDHSLCILLPTNPFRQDRKVFSPSTLWEHGGPIIERAKIGIERTQYGACWGAWMVHCAQDGDDPNAIGDTPLIAAMRAFVASKFGDEISEVE